MILYNFIINKIKKVLINNNFTEIKPELADSVSIQKYFWQELFKINIEIINTENIFQICYLIKILDNIFDHELNLENYVLKINCSERNLQELQDILQILSVNFIIDNKLDINFDNNKFSNLGNNKFNLNKIIFEFSCNNIIFAAGGSNLGLNKLSTDINLEKLEIFLQNNKNLSLPQAPALNLIVPMSKKQQTLALLLANDLYFNSICTDILFYENKQNIDNIMSKANKMGARFVLILGEREQEENTVTIINVQTRQSNVLKQVEVAKFLK